MNALCFDSFFALFLLVRGENFCQNKTAEKCIDIAIEKAIENFPQPWRAMHYLDTIVLGHRFVFSDGLLWGFETLHRVGLLNLISNQGSYLYIGLLNIDILTIKCKWTSFIHKKNRNGHVFYKASNVTIYFHIDPNDYEEGHAVIKMFELNQIENTLIEVTGLDYLSWMKTTLTDELEPYIQKRLEIPVKQGLEIFLQMAFDEIRLPVENTYL